MNGMLLGCPEPIQVTPWACQCPVGPDPVASVCWVQLFTNVLGGLGCLTTASASMGARLLLRVMFATGMASQECRRCSAHARGLHCPELLLL